MAHTNIICQHGPCVCEVAEQGAFCSSYCKEAWDDNLTDPVCKCGHADCRSAAQAAGTSQDHAS